MKKATITPVHKKSDTLKCQNYRPISVLPFFSKIFERYLYDRLCEFFEKNSLFSSFQFGFRKGLSTQDAILNLTEYLYETLNNKEIAICIFIDYQKAFDTINHKILLSKLVKYGIRGKPLELFRDYLSNRQQRVKVGDFCSEFTNVSIGIPQGSILGSLLFIIYINEFPKISNCMSSTIFADDTTITFRSKSIEDLFFYL